MMNRRAHSKSLRSLLVLMILALPCVVVWAGAPQDVCAQDVGPGFPTWRLLPRTPFSPALRTEALQPVAEQTDETDGSIQRKGSNPSVSGSGEAFTLSRSASVRPSNAEKSEGLPPAQGHGGPRTTDPGLPLMMPSTVVWPRVSQAMTALRTELAFPSLLPRTPLSRALWTEQTQPLAQQTAEPAAGSALGARSEPSETWSGSAVSPSQPGSVPPESGSAGILPATAPAVRPEGLFPALGYYGPRSVDLGPRLMMPSTAAWERISEAITILHVEPEFPSVMPLSPVATSLWAHEPQLVGERAKQGEKGKTERGESAAPQPPPVLLATDVVAADQLPAQGQSESRTAGHAGTAATSQRVATLARGGKGGSAPNQAGKSASSEKATTRTSSQPPEGENGKGVKGEPPASRTVLVHPSSTASQNAQPKPQGYHGPGTTHHASAVALQATAGEFSGTPGGKRALRDPFKLPPPPRPDQEEKDDPKLPGNRPPGSRGLLVEQLKLKGVVRDSSTQKMIAVVTANNNRAYFLQEGEAVYDGVVSKITSDAVYFKGNIFDTKRESRSREVVKTLSPAPGEVK